MHLLVFILVSLWSSHDVQVAFYTISQEDDSIIIDFEFEKDDILLEFQLSNTELSIPNFENYLEEHFSCTINQRAQDLSFEATTFDDKHVSTRAKVSGIQNQISDITIDNTCLISIEEHSNIIQVHLHEKQRDFLMNKDRTQIRIQY